MHKGSGCIAMIGLVLLSGSCGAQEVPVASLREDATLLALRERVQHIEEWLQWKVDHFLPRLMEQDRVNMWILTEDDNRTYPFIVPAENDGFIPRNPFFLVVSHEEDTTGVDRRLLGNSDRPREWGPLFPDHVFTKAESLDRLAETVRDLDPERIAVGSAWNDELEEALGAEFSSRLLSDERLSGLWIEYRTPQQIEAFKTVIDITHEIIAEAFSNQVVTPDVTTTDDIFWWFRQKVSDLGLDFTGLTVMTWRSQEENEKYGDPADNFRIDIPPRAGVDTVVRRGDVLTCDFGVPYLGLQTDIQQLAYVLKEGETNVPQGLQDAMRRGNRLQDLVIEEFSEGLTGNEILMAVLKRGRAENLRPEVYSHTLGSYVYRYGFKGDPLARRSSSFGPSVGSEGLFDERGEQLPSTRGELPVHYNTTYSMELDVTYAVPEWGGQDVRIVLEEDVAFTEDGLFFPGGRQTEWLVIR